MDERSNVWAEPDGSSYYEEQIKTAAAVDELDSLSAATNRVQRDLFRALIRCELRRVWLDDGSRDIAHWVALRLAITTYKARRWVACAWALERYPLFEAAFIDGRLSVDKLVELTRLADAEEDEPERKLLSWALKVAIATIRERADWAIRIADDKVQDAHRERGVRWWWDQDNTFVNLSGTLPADMGIRITGALERLARKLPESPENSSDPDASLEARRADALDLLASQSIAADKDPDRATVVVHVPLSALVSGDSNGCDSLGHAIHPDVISRLTCDGRVQCIGRGDDGAVTGIGHTSRVIPRWLRRAVERRDGFRCTFPNCGSRLGLDCHHVVPWPDGPTDVDNLTLLCRTHHRLVHDYGWHLMLAADQSTRWSRPDRTPYEPRPPSEVDDEARREPEPSAQEELVAITTTVEPNRERSRDESPAVPWWERVNGAAVF